MTVGLRGNSMEGEGGAIDGRDGDGGAVFGADGNSADSAAVGASMEDVSIVKIGDSIGGFVSDKASARLDASLRDAKASRPGSWTEGERLGCGLIGPPAKAPLAYRWRQLKCDDSIQSK